VKAALLMLAHRIPWPPNKGEKLRAWQWLQRLAVTHRVHLGCFVDDPADWAGVEVLRGLCASVCARPLNPRIKRLQSLPALAGRGSLTERYFFDPRLREWVAERIASTGIAQAFVYCSAMAPYVRAHRHLVVDIDMVDVDSQKWALYAERQPVLGWLYRRESAALAGLELEAARRARNLFLVTAQEVASLAALGAPAGNLTAIENGVDAAFFSPTQAGASPYGAGEMPVVFTGVMDYWPNVDAVCWFVREIWPAVRAACPAARFYVVGMRPARAVRALAGDSVVVTGRVADVRPYLAHAAVAVAPLRVARGVQNKVLEAMAMGCAVVASEGCSAAIAAEQGREIIAAAGANHFAAALNRLLHDASARRALGHAARARVVRDYSWETKWRQMAQCMGVAQ